jgi:acyl-CoA reductase-like NAD-dependent aldehyde dehydrogenase
MRYVHHRLFIDGAWFKPSSADRLKVICASTEEPIGEVPDGTRHDVDLAVAAARKAFDASSWPRLEPAERADVMGRLAAALDKRAQQMAERVSLQNGMPIQLSSQLEGIFPSALLCYYADLAEQLSNEEQRPALFGGSTIVRREAVGVVAAVVPWNAPQALTFVKLAPALAAGCAVVVKPSPETVLDAFLLAEAIDEAEVPPGVINIVPGGREVGAYLVQHPGVDIVAFTGSTSVGRQIGGTCGRLLRRATLELGGKSAAIVFEDADLAATAQGLVNASFFNNGQACYNCTRILAPQRRYKDVLDSVADMARSLQVGDALDPDTEIGPMVSARHRERVEAYIAQGIVEGARVVVGGGRPANLHRGWFVQPTVFDHVDNRTTIARAEIFGPVVTVIPYSSIDEAVDIANDSDYGLGGSVWTSDPEKGVEIARRVRTGTIGVNEYFPDIGAPFGGVKASGLGRELGPEGLAAYQQYKSIYLPSDRHDDAESLRGD